MDQKAIGKFILEQRKLHNMTQMDLADKLGISDRAISKWERGLNLPDASLMIELASILDITVNELLTGKMIEKESYQKKAEENLVKLERINELSTKRLLQIEWVIFGIATSQFIVLSLISIFLINSLIWQILIIVFGFIIFFTGAYFTIKIEQKAGYYECKKCHNRYIPTFNQVCFSMHFSRTRYMKCPKCGKRSWNEKIVK